MIAPHIAAWALAKSKRKSDEGERVAAVVATRVDNINDTKKKYTPYTDGERVLETKGGGGYQPPPQPSPREQAEAREWEAAQEFQREERREEREQTRADTTKAASDAAWQSGRGAAYTGAVNAGRSRLGSLGLLENDPYGVTSQWTNRLDQGNAQLQPGADYSASFSPTILDEILGTARTSARNKIRSDFDKTLSPYYAEDTFASTADDAILNSILDQQYQDAMGDITMARDRGTASNTVTERALKELERGKGTALSELQGIGGGVLEKIRGDVGGRRQRALDAAAEWDFGQTPYDVAGETGRIRNYAGEQLTGLEGQLRGAVGSKRFFDPDALLGGAKAKVGMETGGTAGTAAGIGGTGGTGGVTGGGTGGSSLYNTFQNEVARNMQNIRQNEGTF